MFCCCKDIRKNRSTAFVLPSIPVSNLDEELVTAWSQGHKTLKQWSTAFQLAESVTEDRGEATNQAFLEEEEFKQKAKVYKTPKKEKVSQMIDISLPKVYSTFEPESDSISSEDDATQFMNHIEQAFKTLNLEILKLNKNQVVMQDLIHDGLSSLDVRVKEIENEIGSKPVHLEQDYDAPNLWSGVSTLATFVSEIKDQESTNIDTTKARAMIDSAVNELELKEA